MVDNTVTGEVGEEMEASLLLSTDIERLKKQKRVIKTQTSKLYTKLLRLMSNEKSYKKAGDKQNAVKTEDELEIVTKDTNRDVVTVKSFIVAMITKPMKRSPDVLDTAQSKEYRDGVNQPYTSKIEVDEVKSWKELRQLMDDCERRAGEEMPVKTEGVDRSLERLQIPKFDGDKWKLKTCLKGKAAEAILKLGYSEEAYEETKKTLIRKFGGNRRQIQAQLEDLRNTTPFQDDDVQEIEKFCGQFGTYDRDVKRAMTMERVKTEQHVVSVIN
ncbi:Hypothetical predicted protein [Paramuricea clavata]|uniref:Uncharacterized protein n=1 Tax=Paramuricea clavata TaxID=317549 RepID=A0A7D9JYC3_PARCT|nr:Hypothetical predicted protein [Paramuricea clavata]